MRSYIHISSSFVTEISSEGVSHLYEWNESLGSWTLNCAGSQHGRPGYRKFRF